MWTSKKEQRKKPVRPTRSFCPIDEFKNVTVLLIVHSSRMKLVWGCGVHEHDQQTTTYWEAKLTYHPSPREPTSDSLLGTGVTVANIGSPSAAPTERNTVTPDYCVAAADSWCENRSGVSALR
jgi:hypothetical protein